MRVTLRLAALWVTLCSLALPALAAADDGFLSGAPIEAAAPVAQAAAPVAQAAAPVAQAAAPVAGTAAPVAKATAPVTQAAAPVVEAAAAAVAAPVTEATAPIVKAAAPVVQTAAEPASEPAAALMDTVSQVTEVAAPIAAPVIGAAAAPVIGAAAAPVAGAVAPLAEVAAPVVELPLELIAPVVQTVDQTTQPVAKTAVELARPVVEVTAKSDLGAAAAGRKSDASPKPPLASTIPNVAPVPNSSGAFAARNAEPQLPSPGAGSAVMSTPRTPVKAPKNSTGDPGTETLSLRSPIADAAQLLFPPDRLRESDSVASKPTRVEQAPIPLRLPDTPVTSGTAAFGGSGAGGFGLVAVLLTAFFLVAPTLSRWLRLEAFLVRPPMLVSLLERPG